MSDIWKGVLERPSTPDCRQPIPVGPTLWQLMEPVTLEELNNTIISMSVKAPGADGPRLTDLRKMDRRALLSHFNLRLLTGFQPSSLCIGHPTLIPKDHNV